MKITYSGQAADVISAPPMPAMSATDALRAAIRETLRRQNAPEPGSPEWLREREGRWVDE